MAYTSIPEHERQCAVCTKEFTTPKILPCEHIMCRECIICWMDAKPGAGCPLCRCSLRDENSNQSTADVVDSLPTDYVMEALVDSARVLLKKPVCCACDVTAEVICMQCLDMLCSSCVKIHQHISATRSHEVESLSTVTPERLAANRPALCADRGDKQAEFFCTDHHLAVCASCGFLKHKGCKSVWELDEEMKSAKISLNTLTDRLLEAEQELNQAIGKLYSYLQEVDASMMKDMRQVDIACDRLHQFVDTFRTNLKDMSKRSHSKVKNSISDVVRTFDNRLLKVTSQKRTVERTTAVAARPALIHAAKVLTDRVNGLHLHAHLEADEWMNPPLSSLFCEDLLGRIEKDIHILMEVRADSKEQNFRFYRKKNSDPQTSVDEVASKQENGYILAFGKIATCESSEPLAPNVLYQIRLDKSDRGNVYYGVSGGNEIFTRYSVLGVVGSVGGVMIDSSNHLHFYLDGHEIATFKDCVPRPCFALFQFTIHQKVTLISPVIVLT